MFFLVCIVLNYEQGILAPATRQAYFLAGYPCTNTHAILATWRMKMGSGETLKFEVSLSNAAKSYPKKEQRNAERNHPKLHRHLTC